MVLVGVVASSPPKMFGWEDEREPSGEVVSKPPKMFGWEDEMRPTSHRRCSRGTGVSCASLWRTTCPEFATVTAYPPADHGGVFGRRQNDHPPRHTADKPKTAIATRATSP